jgi:hypothetical protein
MNEQRCLGCGRDTGVGTSRFAGRLTRNDPTNGEPGWVCASCAGDGVLEKEVFSASFLRGAELGDIAR